ncbi:MAG TPA: hypothetical protein VFE58_12525 [Tepidisphaeraceae bacterium]|jgi:hypothetical protein|nr:hypothetical protein [Tepidisphaeraceae bacterium]
MSEGRFHPFAHAVLAGTIILMAKAKKSTEETGAEEKKPASKKKAEPKSKPAAKKTSPATAGGFGFGIDTNLAAQSAAKMLMGRSTQNMSTGGTVKHLKDTMAKQSGNALGNLLGSTGPGSGKSSNLPHFSNQQKGHNQATGHVGNTGVPRRTPG